MADQQIKLSIIICTYNRAEFLESAVDALLCQTVGLNSCEVIIVNNNSTDETQIIAEKVASTQPHFRVVFEKKQGLSHARNRGYKEATSEWVAYLDDDAKASENYVERMLYVIDHYDFDCFGGVYLPWYKYGKPKWYKAHYASNGFKLEKTGVLEDDYVSGGVIVFKKSVLERFNGFPVNLGMKGKKIAYGEENFLQVRMRQAGYRIGFDPNLRIKHVVSLNKLKVSWFLRSSFAKGRGTWITYGIKKTPLSVFRIAVNCCYFFVSNSYRYPFRLSNPDYYLQNLIMDLLRPVARACGQMLGPGGR